METRDGLIEFRFEEIFDTHERRGPLKIRGSLQYRQCFKGIWTPWKDALDSSQMEKLMNRRTKHNGTIKDRK